MVSRPDMLCTVMRLSSYTNVLNPGRAIPILGSTTSHNKYKAERKMICDKLFH